jgi:aquaporin Z
MRTDKYLAEFLGTLLLMMGVLASGGNPIVVGLALAVGIFFSASISGGHLNPAVSVGFYVKGGLSAMDLAAYIVSQSLGAVSSVYIFKMLA